MVQSTWNGLQKNGFGSVTEKCRRLNGGFWGRCRHLLWHSSSRTLILLLIWLHWGYTGQEIRHSRCIAFYSELGSFLPYPITQHDYWLKKFRNVATHIYVKTEQQDIDIAKYLAEGIQTQKKISDDTQRKKWSYTHWAAMSGWILEKSRDCEPYPSRYCCTEKQEIRMYEKIKYTNMDLFQITAEILTDFWG